ncbi:MAG: tRNA(fMet)-specific endonuclease VapC [Firmicutes bacterium ADurb.Bin506]|nr:MAG: tRNA(fMet)-specific endonuclease VapC [Firmicutes bacterium ADurb.Bin506]
MRDNVLVDTNIIAYAYDTTEPPKQKRALAVLDDLVDRGVGAVSTQVLAELFVVLTRKLRNPIRLEDAVRSVAHHARIWQVFDVTPMIVLEAARGVRDHCLSFWDAQLWATAKLNQVPVVLSEGFSDGSVIEGVQFKNPLA